MKIQVLGGYGGESIDCRMTCLLVNDGVALDAGSLSQALPVEEQVKVHSIVLSHSHMDHTNSLPFFIENVYGKSNGAIRIHSSPATIYAIRKYLFNNATWPDFTRLPNHLLPAVQFEELADEVALELDGVSFTPIPVDHLVPTHGFLLRQGRSAVLWSSDTGPTTRFWEVANQTPDLKALCIEVSFDNGELTLKGEKKFEGNDSATLHRRERLYGTFTRTRSGRGCGPTLSAPTGPRSSTISVPMRADCPT